MTAEPLPQSGYPHVEVINVDGRPVWRVCGGGICAEAHSGHRALELFWARCASMGLTPPA